VFAAFALAVVPGAKAAEAPVPLGSASNFAVLAGDSVSSTGFSVVNGDIGKKTATPLPGFPPAVLHGILHAGDPVAAQAQADLTVAYINAAGRSLNPVTLSGNIGGQTLTPGLYKSTSSLAISSGDLTLDAGGVANAVFIFQIASTLTTTSGRLVILSGGAQARNIYWQVGSSATLGTTSVLKGNILAQESITLKTGAQLEGRALARVGGVTLDANTVTALATQQTQPSFGQVSRSAAGLVNLSITNTVGLTLTIQYSANLKDWIILSKPTPAISPYLTTDPTAGTAMRFYRAYYP
jgi:hypothetical protein